MPFGVMSGVGRGTGVLDRGDNRGREGAVLGVNLRRPIVTNKNLLLSCARATRLISQITLGRTCYLSATRTFCGMELCRIGVTNILRGSQKITAAFALSTYLLHTSGRQILNSITGM